MSRVLMLHGFEQNATIFSKRTGAIRKACGQTVEFVYIDAPIILLPTAPQLDAPAGSTEIARAWWRTNTERTHSRGLLESLIVLRDVLHGSHFDGVFGFSQGAAMAALLAALLEKPQLCPEFLVDDKPPHPPLKFCIAISGFVTPDPLASKIFAAGYTTPTLHVIGQTDIIVIEERSNVLVNVSRTRRVERHPGGHFVPSSAQWRELLCNCIREPSGHIPFSGGDYQKQKLARSMPLL